MDGPKMVWDGKEYEVRHQTVRSLRRVSAQAEGSAEYALAVADMAAEMVPGSAEVIEGLQVDQLDRFVTEAVTALAAGGPFPGGSGVS